MYLLEPDRWLRQPDYPVEIDWASPFADQLRFFVAFFEGVPVDYVSQVIGSASGSAAVEASGIPEQGGRVAKLANSTSDYYSWPDNDDHDILGDLTLAWRGTVSGAAVFKSLIAKCLSSGATTCPFDLKAFNTSNPQLALVRANSSGSPTYGNYVTSGSIASDGTPQTVEVTSAAPISNTPSFWLNGVGAGVLVYQTGPAMNAQGTSVGLRIGRRDDGTVQHDGTAEYGVGWARTHDAAFLAAFRAAPYALFRKRQEAIYSLPSGGGVTASASITDAADTASSAATVAIAGAASITDASDSVSSASTVAVGAAASITDAVDSLSSAGAVAVAAQAAITDDVDTLIAAGTVGSTGITADAAITDAVDTVSAAATVQIAGAAAITDDLDSLSAVGAVAIAAAFSVTDELDTVTAAGTVYTPGAGPTAEEIADAVWDELMVGSTSARQVMSGMADFLRARGYLP